MGQAERYRHYAAECLRLAQHCSDNAEKEMLLGIAKTWRRLADREQNPPELEPESK
jgi:hypothetical protein